MAKSVFPAEGAHSCTFKTQHLGGLGVCSPRKFWDVRLSEMVSDTLFKRKKSLPMPNQNNLEHFLVIVSVIFHDNLQPSLVLNRVADLCAA